MSGWQQLLKPLAVTVFQLYLVTYHLHLDKHWLHTMLQNSLSSCVTLIFALHFWCNFRVSGKEFYVGGNKSSASSVGAKTQAAIILCFYLRVPIFGTQQRKMGILNCYRNQFARSGKKYHTQLWIKGLNRHFPRNAFYQCEITCHLEKWSSLQVEEVNKGKWNVFSLSVWSLHEQDHVVFRFHVQFRKKFNQISHNFTTKPSKKVTLFLFLVTLQWGWFADILHVLLLVNVS